VPPPPTQRDAAEHRRQLQKERRERFAAVKEADKRVWTFEHHLEQAKLARTLVVQAALEVGSENEVRRYTINAHTGKPVSRREIKRIAARPVAHLTQRESTPLMIRPPPRPTPSST
jgi:hypothetical protein